MARNSFEREPAALPSRLGAGFSELEHSLLRTVDKLGLISLVGLARIYFNSPYTARDRIRPLCQAGYLERVAMDSATVQFSIAQRPSVKNPVLGLAHEGYRFLQRYLQVPMHGRPRNTSLTAAVRWPHAVGTSEAISYVIAAARATYEPDCQLHADDVYQLSVGWWTERESLVYVDPRMSLACRRGNSVKQVSKQAATLRPMVMPDATLILGLARPKSGSYPVQPQPARNARWSPTRHTWQNALMSDVPSPAQMRLSEDVGEIAYRFAFLELETGSNSSRDLLDKIERYNRLFRAPKVWGPLYGAVFPQVLVVVRRHDQVERQVRLWRKSFGRHEAGAVLVTSLQQLASVESMSRRALLTYSSCVDAMSPQQSEANLYQALTAGFHLPKG